MQIKLIVAMTPDRLIGSNGTLPWHEPADLKHFRKLTTGHAIIMGRKTYDSLGKPLKARRNIVVSRSERPAMVVDDDTRLDFVTSLDAALDLCRTRRETTAFVIGGAQIFDEALPLVGEMIVTWIDQLGLTGDTYFPEWSLERWAETESFALSPTARVVHYRRRT